jgi:CBS domain containing-hemolysin-like protein
LPREAGVETLAGFMLSRLGHIPVAGEHVDFGTRQFTVVEMDGKRIARVRVDMLSASGKVAPKMVKAKSIEARGAA